MDYAQLIGSKTSPGSIAAWMNNSTIVNDVPEIVLEGEAWIYRRLRHFLMLTPPVMSNMVIGQDFIEPPADMLEPYMLFLTQQFQQMIYQRTPQEVIWNWAYDGNGDRVKQQPMSYYFDQCALRLDSPPDRAYQYGFIYFQQPQPLAVTNTNFLTDRYPRLVRLVCMAAACEWAKDSGVGNYDRTYFDQLAQDELEKAQIESDRAKRGTVAGAVLIGGGMAGNFPTFVTGY